MIEIPQKLIDGKPQGGKTVDPGVVSTEKASSPPLYESDAPPPPPDFVKPSMAAPQWPAASDFGAEDMSVPIRLQVIGWDPAPGSDQALPLTPRGAEDAHTPRDGAETPRTPRLQGTLTVTTTLGEAVRGDAEWLCAPSAAKPRGASSKAA